VTAATTLPPMGWTHAGTGTPGGTGTPDGPDGYGAELPGNWSPTLSPDGRHAGYVSDRGGTPQVWLQPVGSEVSFLVDTGPHPVDSVSWSPDGGWLACVLAPGGAPRTEVWLVRPDGSALHQVGGFGADSADLPRWLPGRSLLAITENSRRALLVDPAGGSTRTVAEGELLALLDLSVDGERALLRRGPRGQRQIAVRELRSGEDRVLVPGDAACFGPDGHTVYARTDLGGELAKLVRIRATGLSVLAERVDAELESFAVTADGTAATLVWNGNGGVSELTALELATGRQRSLSPLPGTIVSGCAYSADGGTLAFTAEGPAQPQGVWIAVGTAVAPVAVSAIVAAVVPRLHQLSSADGLTVSGWLYRPDGAGPYPTVLSLHGGPEAQERPGYNPLFQSLVSRGIAVFAPNVRGSAGFGRSFVNADNGAGRYGAIADVAACVAYLVSAGIAEPGRIGCLGRSYGGYLTLAALVNYPELFSVGIDVCGMANFATFYARTEPWIAGAAISKYGHPVADRDLLRDLSPITRIDRLAAPLLVVHGANDTNVPVCEAEQVVAALRSTGVPHRLLLFEDEGHDFLQRTNRATYLRIAVEWLTTHLPVTRPALPYRCLVRPAARIGVR
jgi:dipeptidyl aminopeptidase/acylaminoacyl peptidase